MARRFPRRDGARGRRFGLILAGGDTTKYPSVVISLTVLGEVDRGKAILRSGARPGDLLCVSGRLGEAELGLRLIQRELHKQKRWTSSLKKHFYPEPRLALGEWLAAHRLATSMIDTSDGLSTDLGHICKASGVGATYGRRKSRWSAVPQTCSGWASTRCELALNGGEDYELLFTVPKRLVAPLAAQGGRSSRDGHRRNHTRERGSSCWARMEQRTVNRRAGIHSESRKKLARDRHSGKMPLTFEVHRELGSCRALSP